jgi:carbon monoxide dehydrogenase subunit G
MKLTGEYRLDASRQDVWAMLLDADLLRRSIPGCQSLEGSAEDGFSARVRVAVGPIKAVFDGKVTLSELNAPQSCTLAGKGQGGIAGFASGEVRVTLSESDGATVLQYAAEAMVGGKLAQLGGRLIDATAARLAGEFFASFAQLVADRDRQRAL